MATLRDSLVSSSARPLALRRRLDLSARQQRYQGRMYWIVKEPLGLNYFRFQEEEYAILQWLDGESSLDDLKARFEKRFPPEKITVEELQQFIGTLHKSGLIVADVPGQGRQLFKRRWERRKKELLAAFSNILAIRFKGIDPQWLLSAIYPWIRWVYRPWAVAAAVLLWLAALVLLGAQFQTFQARLPDFHQFFTIENALWLSICLAVTKVIHEFGHGLTCKHFGGECHEMGVMVLVLTPCLYCNVSDSWMLPNKWHRAAIGAAGMYVELVIASICTFVWWYSAPGLLNNLALSTMFVCSVSTIIFNANPLLRYDGYYILSDILEIPNLRQKSTTILARKLGKWCLGLEEPDDPFLPQRNQLLFASYTVAAAIYRWVVAFSIMWFLYNFFKPYGLEIIGQAIMAASLYGLLIQPLWQVGKFLYVPGRLHKVKKANLLATAGVVTAMAAGILFIPLPYRVICPVEIRPRNAVPVYVEVAGELEALGVRPGDKVRSGDQLAVLASTDLDLEIMEIRGKIEEQKAKKEGLRKLRFMNDDEAALQIPAVDEAIASFQKQLEQKEADLQRLVLYSPTDGTIIPPPVTEPPPEGSPQLPTWSETPLESKNMGAWLNASTLFCQVGNPAEMEASLVVDQGERNFVAEGQTVEIQLDQTPDLILSGQIEKIADREMTITPKSLSNKGGGEVSTETDESGVERPMSTSYLARVPLDNSSGLIRVGLTGKAKIHAGTQTIGQRFWRYLTQTFHFRL
jgi:putative peptide zinc metalloprotease protein